MPSDGVPALQRSSLISTFHAEKPRSQMNMTNQYPAILPRESEKLSERERNIEIERTWEKERGKTKDKGKDIKRERKTKQCSRMWPKILLFKHHRKMLTTNRFYF